MSDLGKSEEAGSTKGERNFYRTKENGKRRKKRVSTRKTPLIPVHIHPSVHVGRAINLYWVPDSGEREPGGVATKGRRVLLYPNKTINGVGGKEGASRKTSQKNTEGEDLDDLFLRGGTKETPKYGFSCRPGMRGQRGGTSRGNSSEGT